jgi:hypothetical protein
MKTYKSLFLSLMIAAVMVAGGCRSAEPVPVDTEAATSAETTSTEPERGAFAEMSDTNLLAFGTMELEGTGNAVTSGQAAKLLPLWTAIQSGSLQGTAETDAVLKQIRGQMSADQFAAMDVMALTQEDYGAWLQEQGVERPAFDGEEVGGAGALGDMSEEDRAAMREQFRSMTDDERATARVDMGLERPEGGAGSLLGRNPMLQPLIDLLTERAAE